MQGQWPLAYDAPCWLLGRIAQGSGDLPRVPSLRDREGVDSGPSPRRASVDGREAAPTPGGRDRGLVRAFSPRRTEAAEGFEGRTALLSPFDRLADDHDRPTR